MSTAPQVVDLDVRPYLRQKLEPFQIIMETVKKLGPQDTLVLHATFKPTPLLVMMKTKGFDNEVEQKESDHWVVTFTRKKKGKGGEEQAVEEKPAAAAAAPQEAKAPAGAGRLVKQLDNRGLEPPQPMVRTLKALEACQPGEEIEIHNDRVPVFLLEELNKLGSTYSIDEQPDGSAKVRIRKN